MTDLPPPTPAGKLLRRAREMAVPKLSRPDVAHSAGIDPGTLGNIERGYRHLGEGRVREVPGEADVIAKVARVLKIHPDRLADEGQRPDAAGILREILRSQPDPRPPATRALAAVPDDADEDAVIEMLIAGERDDEKREVMEQAWRFTAIPRAGRLKMLRSYLEEDAGEELGERGERRREPGA